MRYWANLRKLGATAALTAFVAGSAIGASGEEPRRIEPKAAIETGGEHYALLVGVNDYGGMLKTLKYAVSDVERIAGALEKIGFPSENIRKFVSGAGEAARPSRKRILNALDEIIEKSSPKSTIFVAFSGHGFETVEDGAAAFCPTDAEVEFRGENGDEPCVLRESAILMADVVEKLQKDDANFKMLIVDACREPAATNRASASDGDGKKGGVAARVGAPKENGSKAFAKIDANGLAFLQSCSSQQFSWEDAGLGGGIFTYYFVEGLGGAASTTGDGVTFLEVCGYAQRKTVERTNADGFWLQRPAWKFKSADGAAESDDFYLIAPKKPKEAAAKLAEAKELRASGGLANLRSALKVLDEALGLYRYTDATKEAVRAEREAAILALAAALADEARAKLDAEAFDEAVALAEEARGTFKASLDPTVPKEYDDLATDCKRRRDGWKTLDEAEAALASRDLATATAKVEAASALYDFARGREIKAKLDAENVEAAVLYRRGRAAAFGAGRKLDARRGFELLNEAAESGSTDAKGALAVLYFDGCAATPPNFAEAFKLAKEASDAGNPWGQWVLGECRRVGRGVAKDKALSDAEYKKARAGFAERADADPLASTYLGLCCYFPRGGAQNWKEASRRFREAADAGLPVAARWLGACYQYGYDVEKDEARAFDWYRKGAEAGDAGSMCCLGWCYEKGFGVYKDASQAFDWYRRGAEAGDAVAMGNLGWCYEKGFGVDKDASRAFDWYRQGAESGDAVAMGNLGLCYEYKRGVAEDSKKAVEWYQKGAESGSEFAMCNLGRCYENGYGVDKDASRAFDWYRKGAEAGNARSMRNLGNCYYNGRGVERDYAGAFRWYQKGAEAGDGAAMSNLGNCYEHGKGVEKNLDEAERWYRKAIETDPAQKDYAERGLERVKTARTTQKQDQAQVQQQQQRQKQEQAQVQQQQQQQEQTQNPQRQAQKQDQQQQRQKQDQAQVQQERQQQRQKQGQAQVQQQQEQTQNPQRQAQKQDQAQQQQQQEKEED